MVFKTEKKGNTMYVTIAGVLENKEADELVPYMEDLLAQDFDEVVFNLSHVPFMTSMAIGKFLIFYRNLVAQGRQMRVKGIDEELLELFLDIKLDTFFPIERE
ncbi:MAG: anti-sigma factor antagonist [Calditrichaeota bacterium]|nr:MAG: anti-sigma factor antagonist [Calditrichota bacterium]